MSLGALDIMDPLCTHRATGILCAAQIQLCPWCGRVEIRPSVLRFSLPSPRHPWDLSVTCLVSFSGTWSAFLRENNPEFPREEVSPRNRAFWEASRSTLTLCAEKYTILNLLKW